jgi:hypothetical protein
MSKFFDSEIVKEQIKEMEDLQKEIVKKTMSAPFMDRSEKREHVDLMRQFLDKQRNLCFRIQLSKDPEALEMKERIKEAAIMLGMDPESGVHEFFDKMDETLDYLEKVADE